MQLQILLIMGYNLQCPEYNNGLNLQCLEYNNGLKFTMPRI
jgi:hypothetical protein